MLHQHFKDVVAELTADDSIFAVSEMDVKGHKMRYFTLAPPSMRDIWILTAANAENEYLVFGEERWTYADAHEEVASVANWLTAQGIGNGDRVAVAMRNYPEWVMIYWAVLSVGAVCVGMNAWWVSDEVTYALEDCTPKILITDEGCWRNIGPVIGNFPDIKTVGVRFADCPDGMVPYSDLKSYGGDLPTPDIDTDDVACIFYTSGTTGFPKGAQLSHRNCISNLMSYIVLMRSADVAIARNKGEEDQLPAVGEGPAAHLLLTTPLFHVTANNCAMQPVTMIGGKIVFMYKWDAGDALKMIEQEKITNLTGVPVMSREIINHPDFGKYDTSSLVSLGGGGSAFQPELIKDIDKALSNGQPAQGYGMTEVSGIIAGISKDFSMLHPASVGPPVVTMDVKIVDAQNREVPAGEVGEICVRGSSVFVGYLNKPEATAEAIRDGWLHTGDVGYLDEHGFLYITDRIKDMLIRGGENVYSSEVEVAIYDHKSVAECAVFGVPDERLGEEVGVVVYLKPGETATAEELREICKAKLAPFKVPRYIWLTETNLPRNASGKILKKGLVEAYDPAQAS